MERSLTLLSLAACLLAAVPLAAATGPKPRAVVLTTDCGADMDDQWALAHLALSPEIELRGVVTTHAFGLPEPAAEFTARTARDVLSHLPSTTTPPVIAGSSIALADKTRPLSNPGVEFLLKQSQGFSRKRRLTVLVIGAATDVASALLTDASLGDRIEIVAMGFNGWPAGGDEWNIKNDPKAWQVLLESRAPITVGDATVTKRDLGMTAAHARELFGERGDSGRYLLKIFTDWLEKHPDIAQNGTWPIWDEVTTAYLLGFTRSETHPRPTLDDKMQFVPSSKAGSARIITWVTAIDAARLWDDFTRKLDAKRK